MKRTWLAALGISLGLVVVPIDFSIVYTSLPAIQQDLKTSLLEIQWIMNIFGVFISSFIVTMGRAGDIIGRRKLYFIGTFLFGLFSLFASLSPNALYLIGARAFQGIAAAIILPVSQALMTHAFPKNAHGKALGIWTAVVGIGLALGPTIGGVLVEFFGWRAIFFINVPITALALLIMLFVVDESKDTLHPPKLDWLGLSLLIVSIGSLVIAIVEGPEIGWSSLLTIFLFVLAALAFSIYCWAEKRTKYPIIKFSLYRNRLFLLSSLANSICIFIVWASMFLIPLYLHQIRELSILHVGFIMLAITIPFTALSPVFGSLLGKVGSKRIISFGLLILLLSMVQQVALSKETAFSWLILALFLFGVGWSLLMGPTTATALSSFPREMAAAASGAWNTIQEVSGSLGLAIIGTIVREHGEFMVGYKDAFILMSLLSLTALILFLFFFKEEKIR